MCALLKMCAPIISRILPVHVKHILTQNPIHTGTFYLSLLHQEGLPEGIDIIKFFKFWIIITIRT